MATAKKQSKMMRAWGINAYREPMQFMGLRVPKPEPTDILIRMHGAEVGDWDDLVREGEWPMERPFPLVLGLAGAGRIAALGKEITNFALGDSVYVYNYPMKHEGCRSPDHNGAWAEYMLVPESYVARAPRSLELSKAGAFPIVGLTAHEALTDVLKVKAGEVLLITAASGGVGHLATQIAKRLDAHVIGTTGPRDLEFVRSLGAEMVVDYKNQNVVEEIRSKYPKGIDKILNGVDDESTANEIAQLLHPGGMMVDLPGAATMDIPGVSLINNYVVKSDAARLTRLAHLFDEGQIKLEIQETFNFERAPDALKRVLQKHVRGKIEFKIA
ncbi:MAG: NADP-dependent oxidoreductase [Bacteriovoracaceae bacterium]|nr:NADP-dependent oxidoreductase [Bacteriovoracaceae bacterium]